MNKTIEESLKEVYSIGFNKGIEASIAIIKKGLEIYEMLDKKLTIDDIILALEETLKRHSLDEELS